MNNYYGCQQPYGYQYGYQNYQQPMNQIGQPNQMQQQMIAQNNESSIVMCDSVDYVKSQNVRLDGGVSYYGLTNGQSIYAKKLNPNTGSSIIQEYRLIKNEQPDNNNSQIIGMIQNLQENIDEVKSIVLDYITSPNKKGGEK